jgi:tetratricopeptide (TPR) repeat protein
MDVSKHVDKAQEALRKKNFDYAIDLLQQVLSLQPDHGEARSSWCTALRLKHERKPTAGWLAKVASSPHALSAGLAKVSKSSGGRVRALEKNLRLDPTNPGLYMSLGQALAESNHFQSAVAVFESLGGSDSKQGEAWRMAAACHARLQQVDSALECLEKALQANPRDAESERMRKNLSADATLRSAAYDRAASSRDLMRDRDQQSKLEKSQRIHRSDKELEEERAELVEALGDSPSDGRSRRRLAEIHARKEDFEEAVRVLEAGLDVDENVGDLRDLIGDNRIAALRREIQKLDRRLKEKPSEGLKEDLTDLKGERLALEVKEYRRRVEDRPTDLALWYMLGKALQGTGELDEAISAFQRSVKDPKTRLDSLTRLGSCFFKKGLLDLADKQLTAALEETQPSGERGKAILYNLGLIAEKASRTQDAFQYYSKIYEVDIQYRDVATKIETLQT